LRPSEGHYLYQYIRNGLNYVWNRGGGQCHASQSADLRRPASAATPWSGCRRHRDAAGSQVLHAQGQGHGARRVSHPQHACAARQLRPRPGALPHCRQRFQRRGSPAVLCERAFWSGVGAQRQPDQRAGPQDRAVLDRPPPHQHRERLRGAAQRARARTGKDHARLAAQAHRCVCRCARREQAHQGLLCRDRADRRPWLAGFP